MSTASAISFYFPPQFALKNLEEPPLDLSVFWQWFLSQAPHPLMFSHYHWTMQTYVLLKKSGRKVRLVDALPREGIVVTHGANLREKNFWPRHQLTIVSLEVDRPQARFPFSDFFVVHNRLQVSDPLRDFFIPPWPQANLIPRAAARGHKIENVCYYGIPENLWPYFSSSEWANSLQEIGCNWRIVPAADWHNFSSCDIILAVRDFTDRERFRQKPALKLFNAWHAGVPAILGPEPAYRAERRSELDYIEVLAVEEVIPAIKRLRARPEIYLNMVQNCRGRARETEVEALLGIWNEFLDKTVIPFDQAKPLAYSRGLHRLKVRRSFWQTAQTCLALPGRILRRAQRLVRELLSAG